MTTIYTVNEKINEWTTDVLHVFDANGELAQLKHIVLPVYENWQKNAPGTPTSFSELSLEEEMSDYLEETEETTSREALFTALFEQLRQVTEFVNPLDWDMDYRQYAIALAYDNTWYKVYASCEQDALDILVDYCEEKGWEGYFLSEEDIDNEEHVIRAGNHSRALSPDYLVIKEV